MIRSAQTLRRDCRRSGDIIVGVSQDAAEFDPVLPDSLKIAPS